MDSLENVKHEKFVYVFIPRDIQDDVQVLEFEGLEKNFKNKLQLHFSQEKLLDREKAELAGKLTESAKNRPLDKEYINHAVEMSQTYQIIPLTLPTKKNGYNAVNAYIDSVSRIKNLPTNARATRIVGEDIRGDCFISRTFDDEEVFKRINFTMDDYKSYLENPPERSGRWSETEAFLKMQQQLGALKGSSANQPSITEAPEPLRCGNCRKADSLKKCGRCGKVSYCSVTCQKEDWGFHKRICHTS